MQRSLNQQISARVKISVVDIVTGAIFGMEALYSYVCLSTTNTGYNKPAGPKNLL